jgi:arylsulfatase A-like enzyme
MRARFAHTCSPVRVLARGLCFAMLFAGCTSRLDGIRNVLLVSIDSLRADHLGCYGYDRPTSPTIDRLAAGGVRFANASSPTSWTLPSHVTLLTGLRIGTHLVARPRDVDPPDYPLLAEMLSARGFQTVGFYSGPYLDPAFGFGRGFDEYVSCQGTETDGLERPETFPSVNVANRRSVPRKSAPIRMALSSRALKNSAPKKLASANLPPRKSSKIKSANGRSTMDLTR